MVQMINQEAKFSCGGDHEKRGWRAAHDHAGKFVPTATLHYVRQIKENTAKPNEGAALSMLFAFEPTGKAQLTINTTAARSGYPGRGRRGRPSWPPSTRIAEHRPEWLRDILVRRLPRKIPCA